MNSLHTDGLENESTINENTIVEEKPLIIEIHEESSPKSENNAVNPDAAQKSILENPKNSDFEKIIIRNIDSENKNYPANTKSIVFYCDTEMGYIDTEGNMKQIDNRYFPGHRVGKIKENYEKEAVVFYMARFKDLVQKYERLEEDFKSNEIKSNFYDKVKELIEFLPVADCLGPFEGLMNSLKEFEKKVINSFEENLEKKKNICLKAEKLANSAEWKKTSEELKKLQEEWKSIGPVLSDQSDIIWNNFRSTVDKFYERLKIHYEDLEKERIVNLKKKEILCEKVESLSSSTDWKNTSDELKKNQEEWKTIGPAPILQSDAIWRRFRAALDKFYDRLRVHYEELDKERSANLKLKEDLCKIAESFVDSTDWKKTSDELKRLQERWKTIGAAPIDQSEAIWNRFRGALDKFYERLRVHYDEMDKERKNNLERKEQLCLQAEALSKSTDWNTTSEDLKKLQEEWRTIGPAPQSESEKIWNRFRGAMDVFFERRREFFVQKNKAMEQKHEAWKNRLRETLQRKREQCLRLKESINVDEQNITRWQERINNNNEEENSESVRKNLEEKISDVKNGLLPKLNHLKELEQSIQDIESKL